MKARHFIATSVVLIASLYVIFFALVGYGFGQLFFGTFSWVGTICAVSALGSIFGVAMCAGKSWCRLFLIALSSIAIICFCIEVADYYLRPHSPGNNFAWEMSAPFLLSLVIILAAHVFGWRFRPNTSLERTRDR